MGCGEHATDPRFSSLEALAENAEAACDIVAHAIGSRTFDECVRRLKQGTGAWAAVQDGWDVGNDEALIANGRIVDIVDSDGQPQKLVANPVKFDDAALSLTRAPQFAEHTDDVLRELGLDDDALIELKVAGAIT
jgi:crotonobetainyl-CoA:carnitine CoA-transferase CaiB-like acyl-CoA transferase